MLAGERQIHRVATLLEHALRRAIAGQRQIGTVAAHLEVRQIDVESRRAPLLPRGEEHASGPTRERERFVVTGEIHQRVEHSDRRAGPLQRKPCPLEGLQGRAIVAHRL